MKKIIGGFGVILVFLFGWGWFFVWGNGVIIIKVIDVGLMVL